MNNSDDQHSDFSDFSFEIDNEEFNQLYTKQLQKEGINPQSNRSPEHPQQPILKQQINVDQRSRNRKRKRSDDVMEQRQKSRSRERSRQKKRSPSWYIYDQCRNLEISTERFPKMVISLPIFKKKDQILHSIIHNQITLITGETGCGKSTQVPRLLYQYIRATNTPGKIICVQPRRLAVRNLFKILSSQMYGKEKEAVGYHIAMQTHINKETKIVFMTNGIFLQRLIHSTQVFEEYPFIVLDEVHERDIDTDFILLAVKRIARKYPKLRIILMSATIDNKLFQYYFAHDQVDSFRTRQNFYKKYIRISEENKTKKQNLMEDEDDYRVERPQDDENKLYEKLEMEFLKSKHPCPAINVTEPGKYSKEYFYLDNLTKFVSEPISMKWGTICFSHKYPCANRELNECVNVLLRQILRRNPGPRNLENRHPRQFQNHYKNRKSEAVLIFMPGLAEIQSLASDINFFFAKHSIEFKIIKCHSSMLNDQVTSELHRQYPHLIKVIIATNIAESSITVPGVKYVIDFCLSKEINFDQKSRMENLQLVWASQASCKQRAGRTGRVCDGYVFRLVEKKFYEDLFEYSTPQIQRSSLDKLILRIKLIHENQSQQDKFFEDPGDVLGTAIQPPNLKNIDEAIKSLIFCGGLKLVDGELIMTSLGRIYVDIPLDIIYSKMLIFSFLMGTFDDIVILVCLLSQNKSAFKRIQVEKYFLDFFELMSNDQRCDFLSLIAAYKKKAQKRYQKVELDIFPETRMLISEVVRRFKRKKFFNIKPTSHSKFDYEERFKFTIIYGFLNNLIKVSPMVYDDKQEKRAKLMKKANVPITNTIILLNSGIIRKHAENNDESDNRLRKVWVEHIARTMRFERDKLNLILGYGISYLNFQKQTDLNKFLWVKNMQKNRKIQSSDHGNTSDKNLNLIQVLPHLGDIDYMEEGSFSEFYKEQKINVDNSSINRVVAVQSSPQASSSSYKFLVTNTIIQQSTRLTCRYTSLLPPIPYLQTISHILFYPFVFLLPDRKLTKYDAINLKKRSKSKINFELTDQEIQQANSIRVVIRQLMELKLIIEDEDMIEEQQKGNSPGFSDLDDERYIPKDPRVRKNKQNLVKLEPGRQTQEQRQIKQQKINTFWDKTKNFILKKRKQVVGEQKWQQIYFAEKNIKRNYDQEKFVREEEKEYMNEIKKLKLNYSYFSDLYPSEVSRQERVQEYRRWKVSKYNDVKMLEEKGLNHDAYLVCGVDNCHLKISKMHKIGSISNQYYRDLFDYEKQNIILLENNELDGDHFSNTMMGMYLERQYDIYGCKNRHSFMIKFHDDKRFKITAFSELHILYADGSTEEAQFERLQFRDWKKKCDSAVSRKFATKQLNECFICNMKMNTIKELQLHVKNSNHISSVSGFLQTVPKQDMIDEKNERNDKNDYPY